VGINIDLSGATLVDVAEKPWTFRKFDIAPSPGGAIAASLVLPMSGTVGALLGWAFAETTGTNAAALRLHDGGDARGSVFARINLAANESTRDTFTPHGIRCVTGDIFMEVLAGAIEGVIYWKSIR
jgi:hypothetical protein